MTYNDINLPQLDGQTDLTSGDKQEKRNKNLINTNNKKKSSNRSQQNRVVSQNQSIDENNRPRKFLNPVL